MQAARSECRRLACAHICKAVAPPAPQSKKSPQNHFCGLFLRQKLKKITFGALFAIFFVILQAETNIN